VSADPAAATTGTSTELIERFLDFLIDPNDCIDTLGRTYLDDLERIVAENHGFDERLQKFPDREVQAWFERVCAAHGFASIGELFAYVRANHTRLDLANLRPRSAFQGELMYEAEPSFQRLKKEGHSVEASNEFQRTMSMVGITDLPELDRSADAFEMFMRYDRMNPWTYLIRREIARGTLPRDSKVLCIGNRWAGEILYFRNTLGLKNAVGVDLISTNPDLVVAADMHDMPFEDGSVKMIFTRGTINKSYDVRLFVKEMLRVLAKDGFVIIETPGPFGFGVSRLGPTDVKSWSNLLRLFRGNVGSIIYADAMEPRRYQAAARRLVRVFIRLDQGAGDRAPVTEDFPRLRFALHDWLRGHVLKTRHRLRRLAARFG
jgi:SAM-dependent methyltransferase